LDDGRAYRTTRYFGKTLDEAHASAPRKHFSIALMSFATRDDPPRNMIAVPQRAAFEFARVSGSHHFYRDDHARWATIISSISIPQKFA
jgi:hypothetical protein